MPFVWLEPNETLTAPEGIRGAGHRLDGDAAPLDVRKAVAREDHQVRVALVGPEGGRAHAYPGPAVSLTLEVGEAVVEHSRADRPRLAKVEPFVRHGSAADGDAALVRNENGGSRHVQLGLVDEVVVDGQVRMRARPVRGALGTGVRRLGPHGETLVGER